MRLQRVKMEKWIIAAMFLALFCTWRAARCSDPTANPKSIVIVGKARFTILTTRLIRMEYGQAVDSPTITFINRNLSVPAYKTSRDGDWYVIQTSDLTISYLPNNSSFDMDNLKVTFMLNGEQKRWSPTPAYNATLHGNLLGTIRTLDGANGEVDLDCTKQSREDLHCTLGLVSTEGYVVIDDSGHPQFDKSNWPWIINQSFPQPSEKACSMVAPENRIDCGFPGITAFDCMGKGCCYQTSGLKRRYHRLMGIPNCYYCPTSKQDLYFIGHGHDYMGALEDFTKLAGKIPLPPRYAFGVFYSRYWAYSDIGQMEILNEYKARGIPLDNLVTDMDWHKTFYKESSEGKKDQAGENIGWTGFTWDEHLFPDPKAFLDWCKKKGIHNTLNLHPAGGIEPWEERYSEMANAMGIDPSTQKYVPWNPTDIEFTTNFFKIVLKPLQDQGVDFWWLDWQQGETGKWAPIPMLNPTMWINHIFSTNPYQWQTTTPAKRPLILHRWGGLGNHRYQVGFSGDVVPSWKSLHFQVFFTLKATNVLYGYWSHDIGGHILPSPPELYTRWVQWGAFSPMFRTHCTKNANNDRRIWVYPPENYRIMRAAMILRGALVPYIYTYARYAHDTGLSLLRPMYYNYPESSESYEYDRQYYFGSDILVAPITQPLNNSTGLATKDIWIPKGTYLSWFSGEMIEGPKTVTRSFTLDEIPVYVRAGSIIPMRTDGYNANPLGTAGEVTPDSLKFVVFLGNELSGSGYVYEDDGITVQYMNVAFARTDIQYSYTPSSASLAVTILAVKNNGLPQFPKNRSFQIAVPNFSPAKTVTIAGNSVSYCTLEQSFQDYSDDCWTYDGSTLTLLVNVVKSQPTASPVEIIIECDRSSNFTPYKCNGFTGMLARFVKAKQILDNQWGIDTVYQEDYYSIINASEAGINITYNPTSIVAVVDDFISNSQKAILEVKNFSSVKDDIKNMLLALLLPPSLNIHDYTQKSDSIRDWL